MPGFRLNYGVAVCLFVALALPTYAQLESNDRPLAILDGEPITDADLDIESKLLDLRQQAYQARLEGLDNLITRRIVEKEAAKRGVTGRELLQKEVNDKIADPTHEEIEEFYRKQKTRINKPLEEIREQIGDFLKNQRLTKARNEFVEALKKDSEIRLLLTPPRVPVAVGDSPRRGPADTPVTIVEFSDFQCPYCRRVQPTLISLLQKYPDKVSLVYKDLPLRSIHPEAQKAAEAARCSGEQGKFWEYHDALFEIRRITKDDFTKVASDLKLDTLEFVACLDSGKHKPTVDADFDQAMQIGAKSTPVFYINGVQLKGAQSIDDFIQIIEAELASAATTGGE